MLDFPAKSGAMDRREKINPAGDVIVISNRVLFTRSKT